MGRAAALESDDCSIGSFPIPAGMHTCFPEAKMAAVRWKAVSRLAQELPEVESGTVYGSPAVCVRGAFIARLLDDKRSIVLKVDMDQRDALCARRPETYVVTPEFRNYSMVVVNLATVERDELFELLRQSWRLTAPPSLVAGHEGDQRR